MLFETTPDTSAYMVAGYAVAFIVMSLYILSLYIRNRNLDRDAEMLNSIVEAESSLKSRKEAKAPIKRSTGNRKSVSKRK